MTGPQQVGDSRCMVWRKNVYDLLPREVTRRNEGIAGGGGANDPSQVNKSGSGQVGLECPRDKQNDRHRLLIYSKTHAFPSSQVWPDD
mgnify:CR=1 FL=1